VYFLDTNVVSELRKINLTKRVVWLRAHRMIAVISAVTVGEIQPE